MGKQSACACPPLAARAPNEASQVQMGAEWIDAKTVGLVDVSAQWASVLPSHPPLALSVSWTSYKNWILDFPYSSALSQWPLEVLQPFFKKKITRQPSSIFHIDNSTKINACESHGPLIQVH